MKYNFDEIINRKNTECVKWDSLTSKYGDNDIIPMGIADMDFLTFPGITEAIIKRANHGIFGYNYDTEGYLAPYIQKRYGEKGYQLEKDDIVVVTGVVYALNLIVETFTEPHDKILLFKPYYPPHIGIIEQNDRELVEIELTPQGDEFIFNLNSIKDKVDDKVKMLILCHPQNPTGKIFTQEELKEISNFCQERNIIVVSDEIHSDFAMTREFVPAMSASDYIRDHGITVTSLTKTYSIPGLKIAYCFIRNSELREKFKKACAFTGMTSVNVFGIEACKAALSQGQQWEGEVVEYLKDNCKYVLDFVRENIPSIKAYPNEGTYLVWMDMRNSGIPIENMNTTIIEKARVQLNDGATFGAPGWQRMNVATPRSILKQALERLAEYINNI